MKSNIATALIILLFCNLLLAKNPVEVALAKVEYTSSKALVAVDVHNNYQEGLKSYKVMFLLKNESGKIVGVQSRWLLGGDLSRSKNMIIPAGTKDQVTVALDIREAFKQIEIIPLRMSFEDGTVVTPK